jgi:hypothetical protein
MLPRVVSREKAMLDYLKLHRVGPADDLEFHFANRLNVLTGDNGLGKSFILDIAWWALTRTWAGEPARPRINESGVDLSKPALDFRVQGAGDPIDISVTYKAAKKPDESWTLRRGRPPKTGLVIYAKVNGGYSVWDPSRNYYMNAPGLSDFKRAPAFHFKEGDVWDGLYPGSDDRRDTPYCNGLIKDWETWAVRKPDLFKQFSAVMGELSRGLAEKLVPYGFLRLDVADAREIPTLKLPYGIVPVTLLSAAMRRILALAYLLVWAWDEHRTAAKIMGEPPTKTVVLLVDEIESHLHPQWQRIILPAVLDAVKLLNEQVNIQLLAVTHSPLVLASLENRFEEDRDSLFKFDIEEGKVVVDELNWRPLGDVSTWLTSDVFDLGEARSKEAEIAIEGAINELSKPGITMDRRREIHHRLHGTLGERDPYWINWLIMAKSAGIDP